MQNHLLFKQDYVKKHIEDVLVVWSNEYKDFGYQQGMNDVLSAIVSALATEYYSILDFENLLKTKSDDCDEESEYYTIRRLFLTLHNPEFLWADAFTIFERIMNSGIKELYYKEAARPAQDLNSTEVE